MTDPTNDEAGPTAPRLSHEQDVALRDAIRRAVTTVPGHYPGWLMKPLMDEIVPVVLGFLWRCAPTRCWPPTRPKPFLSHRPAPPRIFPAC